MSSVHKPKSADLILVAVYFAIYKYVYKLLARSSLDRAALVQALAGEIVLCSWARHFTLTMPLSAQVSKWVLVNLMLGVTLRWTSIPSKGK